MSVNLYNATLHNGLFDVLGGAFMAQADINTSRGNTIPFDLVRLMTWFNTQTPTPDLENAAAGVETFVTSFQAGAISSQVTLQQFAQNFLTAIVQADHNQPDSSLQTALQYIITQMLANGDTIERSTLAVAVTVGGNTGNGVILASTKRGDGLVQENAISETLSISAQQSSLTPTLAFLGQSAASSPLGQDWPMGSGITANVTAVDANSSSLLTNGGMDTQDDLANVPDGWILSVGTPGTHCLMTVTAQQSVAISGTPTGAGYILIYTDVNGHKQATAVLDYNATASTVQSALRALNGLEQVTVTSTGTSPNYTHTVVFTGAGGTIPLLTYQNLMTGGTPLIAVANVVVGTSHVYAGGASVRFVSDGSTLTTLNQALTNLSPSTAYAVSLWACADFIPSAGVVTVDLVDGIAGTVLTDAQGVASSISFNGTALLNTFSHLGALQSSECYLRTPEALPANVYLRIRISNAITSGSTVFIDQVALTAAQEIYPGGPLVAAFSGNTPFASADTWTMTVANGRQGRLREWCERNFGMSTLGLLFPSATSPSIPDDVITPYDGQLNFTIAANSEYVPVLW